MMNVTTNSEALQVIGEFSISMYENDKYVGGFLDRNLVVATGKANVAKLLGGDAAGLKIGKIGVGTDGSIALLENTGLTGSFTKNIDGVSYPENGSVLFSFSL